jgi:hypothetical protein
VYTRERDEEWLKKLFPDLGTRLGELDLAGTPALENAIFWAKRELRYCEHTQRRVERDIRSMLRIDTDPEAGLRIIDQRSQPTAA